MPLELRDPSSGSTFQVPDEGLTIGREGGKADFQVKDNGVSKSHCRIYLDGDAWFLEDLGSANGTYLGEDKLAAPTELMPNDVISMSKTRFEVLGQVADDGGDDEQAPPPTPPPAPKAKPPPPPKVAPAAGPKKVPAKPGSAGPAMSAARKNSRPADVAPDDAPAKGVGYFFIAVPKAIVFYLAAIPLLLVNPIGTIKKGIADQKHEPMGKMELIAYAIPALFVQAALPAIATGIVLAVGGTFSLMSFIPIVPAISAVIGAVITGYFFHPVMGWIITKLKGTSDQRSRTNYFLMLMTATAVLAVPTTIATLLGLAARVPFIGLVGVILSLIASLAMLFVIYSWLVFFDVLKVVRTVVLVLGALLVLGAVSTGVMGQVAVIRAMGSSGVGGDVAAQIADAEAKGAKALEEAKEAQEKVNEALGDAKEAGEEAKDAAKEAVKEAKPPKEAEKPAEKEKEKEVVAVAPPAEEKVKPAEKAPVAAVSGGGYPAFAQMRDFVEKKITDDPTLLTRTSGLLDMYRAYESDVFEIDAKYQKETAKKPGLARVNKHLRDAEVYEKTEKRVKEMHGKLR